jgi:hypothetical protein
MQERRCDLSTSIHFVIFGHQMRSAVCCTAKSAEFEEFSF